MKFLTCEGRLSIVYVYHFRFMRQIRNLSYQPPYQRLCISHFLLHTLFEMCEMVKRGKPNATSHHGLIKLIIFQKLQELASLVSWIKFIHSAQNKKEHPKSRPGSLLLLHPKQKSTLTKSIIKKRSLRERVCKSQIRKCETLLHTYPSPLKSRSMELQPDLQ